MVGRQEVLISRSSLFWLFKGKSTAPVKRRSLGSAQQFSRMASLSQSAGLWKSETSESAFVGEAPFSDSGCAASSSVPQLQAPSSKEIADILKLLHVILAGQQRLLHLILPQMQARNSSSEALADIRKLLHIILAGQQRLSHQVSSWESARPRFERPFAIGEQGSGVSSVSAQLPEGLNATSKAFHKSVSSPQPPQSPWINTGPQSPWIGTWPSSQTERLTANVSRDALDSPVLTPAMGQIPALMCFPPPSFTS